MSHNNFVRPVIISLGLLGCTAMGIWLAQKAASPGSAQARFMDRQHRSVAKAPPPPMVVIDRSDLATGVGNAPVRVRVLNATMPVTEEMLNLIAGRTSLRTWPELVTVPSTVRLHPTAATADTAVAYLEVSPVGSLDAAAWYCLQVEPLPSPFGWPAIRESHGVAGGAQLVRFRPAGPPIVRGLRSIARGEGTEIGIVLSEPVRLEEGMGAAMSVTAGLDGCAWMEPGPSPLHRELRLSCSGTRSPTRVVLSPDAHVTSAQGATLEGGKGVSMDFGDWVDRPDGTSWAERKI